MALFKIIVLVVAVILCLLSVREFLITRKLNKKTVEVLSEIEEMRKWENINV